ncbi:hypothetical protein [Brachybacterium sp. GPGPB12]|uniref:hypothetical protein n=1 Tax=Brachybacterium sp. GPGPB12 TaxID=3023517 RepID=UPI0031343633
MIGRSDAALFDAYREPPALLSPGTRVRFTPRRAASRPTAATAAPSPAPHGRPPPSPPGSGSIAARRPARPPAPRSRSSPPVRWP